MNKKEKAGSIILIALIVGMCLYPPYYFEHVSKGFNFILNPPGYSKIDIFQLSFQIGVVVLLAYIARLTIKEK